MQIAHGRHQTDGFALLAVAAQDGSQFFQGVNGSHALNVCSSAGIDHSQSAGQPEALFGVAAFASSGFRSEGFASSEAACLAGGWPIQPVRVYVGSK